MEKYFNIDYYVNHENGKGYFIRNNIDKIIFGCTFFCFIIGIKCTAVKGPGCETGKG